eukprot:CAMPEP_0119423738 /NCGR_PEP_ID=MMETSP1335-20130426/30982_1 /TAXON_ID=259385 /ORGANISM="Chrysoculter rhomboideus, Strain RCC1486" /LENGTH=111 /DNA_ID=CAMNT_0007449233 /DNA_START=109 /DNA_END=444 /DNA_ORIENTATION=-
MSERPLDDVVHNFNARWQDADAVHEQHSSREEELRKCLRDLEKQRSAQLAQCFQFDAKLSAEIEQLQALRVDVMRRVEALEELYTSLAGQLKQTYRDATGVELADTQLRMR